MCTLILAWQLFDDAPIVVAANRDERYDRDATPPTLINTDPQIVAPRDEEDGGTWIGYNQTQVLVAITNRWTENRLDGERSRGLLVRDCLEQETATAAITLVEHQVESIEYEPFNLLIADQTTATLCEWDETLTLTTFKPGIHVIMNAGVNDRFWVPPTHSSAAKKQQESAKKLRSELQPTSAKTSDEWLDHAAQAISDHSYSVCVHGDGFGTRSSSLISLRSDGTETYRFADGPPCQTDYHTIAINSSQVRD